MDKKPVLQTCKPQIGIAEREAINRVLDSGYLGMGPEVQAFEQELEVYLGGNRRVVCVSSGTSALHLAIAALGLQPGDEVLVPSFTFVATFQAIVMAGARPVSCDVTLETGLLDLKDAQQRLTKHTKAVMPVHYAGYPGDLDALYAFAQANNLRVIEDAAHAFGSRHNGQLVGSIGDITCFSFDPIKNITAGEGGAVVTNDETIIARIRKLRNLGIEPITNPSEKPDFDVTGAGWRYHMPDLMAAIGRVQLARFDRELKPAKMAIAASYRTRLTGIEGVKLLESSNEVVPHIIAIRVNKHVRAAIQSDLADAGYDTKIHYKPNHLLTAFHDGIARPVSEQLFEEILTLPSHAEVTEKHIDSIASILEKYSTFRLRDAS